MPDAHKATVLCVDGCAAGDGTQQGAAGMQQSTAAVAAAAGKAPPSQGLDQAGGFFAPNSTPSDMPTARGLSDDSSNSDMLIEAEMLCWA